MDTQRMQTIMSDLSSRTTVVVGASRGLGRGIARAFAEAGAPVVAVARSGPALAALAATSANIRSRVVVVSSGAAINGSPASGGYTGSKATQRFIAECAQEESRRAALNITVTAVMPKMTPLGDVGRLGVRAYAARSGQTEEAYLKQLGEVLTPRRPGPP
jgi:NAD(P)-dependent dehydrogenase (short-subunit alcohol dehydrogenase family)